MVWDADVFGNGVYKERRRMISAKGREVLDCVVEEEEKDKGDSSSEKLGGETPKGVPAVEGGEMKHSNKNVESDLAVAPSSTVSPRLLDNGTQQMVSDCVLSDRKENAFELKDTNIAKREKNVSSQSNANDEKNRTASEKPLIKLISSSLWNLAEKSKPKRKGSLKMDIETRTLVHPFGRMKMNRDKFCSAMERVVKISNDFDIEISCENPLRSQYSLGLRTLISGLCVLGKLLNKARGLNITCDNIYLLTITSMLVSSKYSEDEPLNNQLWAKIADIDLKLLNRCELALVRLLDFDFRVNEELVAQYLSRWKDMEGF